MSEGVRTNPRLWSTVSGTRKLGQAQEVAKDIKDLERGCCLPWKTLELA